MYTFSVGVEDAPDGFYYAREMAKFIGSEHREIVVDLEGMLEVLPKVIYHLESFDAPLVRSSIINYMVANLASDLCSGGFLVRAEMSFSLAMII